MSHGLFSTDNIACGTLTAQETARRDLPDDLPIGQKPFDQEACLLIRLRVWLAPFDFGVRQRVELIFCPSDIYGGFRQIRLRLYREAGEHTVWHNLNRNFINDLRKQLLTWRSLDTEAKDRYETEFMDTHTASHERGDRS